MPDVYGELGDAEAVARRGFELITSDLEWEEPSPVRRQLKPHQAHKKALKGQGKSGGGRGSAEDADGADDDDPLGATAELAKESWEVRILFFSSFFFFFFFFLRYISAGRGGAQNKSPPSWPEFPSRLGIKSILTRGAKKEKKKVPRRWLQRTAK